MRFFPGGEDEQAEVKSVTTENTHSHELHTYILLIEELLTTCNSKIIPESTLKNLRSLCTQFNETLEQSHSSRLSDVDRDNLVNFQKKTKDMLKTPLISTTKNGDKLQVLLRPVLQKISYLFCFKINHLP